MATESRTHLTAKALVANMLRNGPGHLLVSVQEGSRWSTYRMDVRGCSIVEECAFPSGEQVEDKSHYVARHGRLPSMIFDVGLVKGGKVVAAVEVASSHWIDVKKAKKIDASDTIVIEVAAFTREWYVDDAARISCENLFLPIKPLIEFRRMRIGEVA